MIKLKHDILLDISVGKSRNDKNWKNEERPWSDLLNKLSKPVKTHESYRDYMSFDKGRQDEIKDIGGFVGGTIQGGRRKKGKVTQRQVVSLDIDHAKNDLWDAFKLYYDNAACIHTTHKHSPETPRSRLILPLDRPVFPDEYEAIARRIAGTLGIDNFDNTTFQNERLMYWPSTSKDGQFIFQYQDGEFLSADEVLDTYNDWQDASQWPISKSAKKAVRSNIDKQENPTEKEGVIGAFCRTYNITEAIEKYLSDVYEPTDVEDRYTYLEGSTAGGLIVYDNMFAYSHHGTDPVSEKLCNAFDLVRLHKFGHLDEKSNNETPATKLPSYQAMVKFAIKQPEVKKTSINEKIEQAKEIFADINDEEDETETLKTNKKKAKSKTSKVDPDEWKGTLDNDSDNFPYSTIDNILIILKNDPKLKDTFAFNTFEQREVALKNLPWRSIKNNPYLTDRDDAAIRHYFEKVYTIGSKDKIADALAVHFMHNSFHPVKDYLEALQWDGVKRLDKLFIDYLGAEDNRYTRAVTRKWFTAGVKRIFEPGCKFDYTIVLVGDEGIKKSTILDKMGGAWFSDSLGTMETNSKAYEQLQGSWLIELAELSALKKSEVETVKHFIGKRKDKYRVAYGRRTENFPRQCFFGGTTNKRDFLKGINGDRRFWPLQTLVQPNIKDVDKDLTQYEIDQIWAEAVLRYEQKEPVYLSKELEDEAKQVQKEHTEEDVRTGLVEQYLDTLVPAKWDSFDLPTRRQWLNDPTEDEGTLLRDRVCIAEIWVELFNRNQADMNTFNTKELHQIMKNMKGWEPWKAEKTRFKIYGFQKAYVRKAGKMSTRWEIKNSKN